MGNDPIMISLYKSQDGFVGHYTGTMRELVQLVKNFNKKNTKTIDKNYSRFANKYKKCADLREVVSIENPMQYAVAVANMETLAMEENDFALALRDAGVHIEDFEAVESSCEEEVEEITESEDELTKKQEAITIAMLWELIEGRDAYIEKLLALIESEKKSSAEEIQALKAQNKEYQDAILRMRTHNIDQESNAKGDDDTEAGRGHALLGKNEKILVLGNADIRQDTMKAIARDYFGFKKSDFEFQNDYSKIKNTGSRIPSRERYVAIIFGNCPHKVARMGDYTSIIDEFKQRANCPISVDARNEAGGLKITKQSFKKALEKVCEELEKISEEV